jgi:hypothetical protein
MTLEELKNAYPSIDSTKVQHVYTLPEQVEVLPKCPAWVRIDFLRGKVETVRLVGEPQAIQSCRSALRKKLTSAYGKPKTPYGRHTWVVDRIKVVLASDTYSPDPPGDGLLRFVWSVWYSEINSKTQ